MADGDVVEHRAFAMGDGVDLHHFAVARAEAVAGELSERTLGHAGARQDLGLDDHLGLGGDQHVGGLAAHQLQRLVQQPAHDPALVLVDRADGEAAERDRRMHADGEGDGQRFAARFGDLVIFPEMLAEREVNRGRVPAGDHQPVIGAVPHVAVGVPGERDRRGDIGPAVALVVFELGQPGEIDVGPLEHHVLAGPGIDLARRHGLVHRLEVFPQHLAGRRVHRHRETRPAGVEIGEHGVVAAPHVLEQEDRAAPGLLLDLDHRRRHLVAGVHLAGNGYELVRPLRAHAFEIGGEVLSHVSPSPVGTGGTLANGAGAHKARDGALNRACSARRRRRPRRGRAARSR